MLTPCRHALIHSPIGPDQAQRYLTPFLTLEPPETVTKGGLTRWGIEDLRVIDLIKARQIAILTCLTEPIMLITVLGSSTGLGRNHIDAHTCVGYHKPDEPNQLCFKEQECINTEGFLTWKRWVDNRRYLAAQMSSERVGCDKKALFRETEKRQIKLLATAIWGQIASPGNSNRKTAFYVVTSCCPAITLWPHLTAISSGPCSY